MHYSKLWLQKYIDDQLPADDVLVDKLSLFAFEVDGVEQKQIGEKTDSIFDIKVLPNRGHDCLSHRGMAREIAFVFGLKLSKEADVAENLPDDISDDPALLSVSVLDYDACPRYSAVCINGLKVGPSPKWLAEALNSIGQRSINNVVDATNYVLYGLGRPCHAFDAKKLSSSKISVRFAKQDEEITLLSGETKKLESDVLCIADGGNDNLIGIAGIKGGIGAEVDENTTDIIIEMANFDAGVIRRSARRYQILTDASKRFEAGMSSETVLESLAVCARLVKEVAGGEIVAKTDTYKKTEQIARVGLSLERCNAVLGNELSANQIEEVFKKRGWQFEELVPIEYVVSIAQQYLDKPYVYGATLSTDAPECFDCSSFVAYLYNQAGLPVPYYLPADQFSIDQYVGTERISEDQLKAGDLIFSNTHTGTIRTESELFMPGTKVPEGIDHVGMYLGDGYVIHATKQFGKVVKEKLAEAERFKDIIGYGRVPKAEEKRYVVSVPIERLDLRIEEDLIEEIVQSRGYASVEEKNQQISPSSIALPKINSIRKVLIDLGFSEVYSYAFSNQGKVELANPLASDKAFMRTNLADNMSNTLETGIKYGDEMARPISAYFEIGTVFDSEGEYLHLVFGAKDHTKKQTLAKEILEQVKIELEKIGLEFFDGAKDGVKDGAKTETAGIFEIRLDDSWRGSQKDIFSFAKEHVSEYEPFSTYPAIVRDIAMFANDQGKEAVIAEQIAEASGELVRSVRLFDVFTKEGENRTSYAFRLVLQSNERTLTDAEANLSIEPVISALKSEGYEIR